MGDSLSTASKPVPYKGFGNTPEIDVVLQDAAIDTPQSPDQAAGDHFAITVNLTLSG